ncbi:hypothetical protein HJG53_06705 [Sphingomonas sp. ID1715]|uniref:hypothetical protein n=1 Tax=Sphingomonas sp. ID1715 TaxID=1656898 RepID=UPI0017D795FA|nr:hypothetical protein [Sphingomonas sp. ID1715]NNM76587.1 hypothetical protein [Sphingomonas sp. ID1715]
MPAMLFLLGAAIALNWAGRQWPVALAGAVLLAVAAGTTLPDIDQLLPLGHRSALTHSLLPAALALLWREGRAVAAGLALGIGLHLSADLFPEAMRGFATVKLPLAGTLGWQASYMWIGANALACLALGAVLLGQLLGPRLALATLGLVAVIGMAYLFTVDGGWWALAMFGGTGWLALRRGAPV